MTLDELSSALIKAPFPKLSGNVNCIGRNYSEHVKELNNEMPKEPVVFLKAPSALRALEPTPIACEKETFHHEVELVLLVGKRIPLGSKTDESTIAGITLGLDLTRRELQNELKTKGLPWTLAKSFAGSGVLHPIVDFPRGKIIEFSLAVNGVVRQRGKSSDMMFDFTAILNFLLRYQDLHPGDLIYTGTPSGVAGFKQGDQFTLKSETLGIHAEGRL